MTSITERATYLAAQLNLVAGITAVADPAHVSANLPCVLIAPPRITWGTLDGQPAEVVWRVLVLGPGLATWSAVAAMTDLLELVAAELPLETADPGTYQVGAELVACYVATFTDSPAHTWAPAT
jgi:hypothetical protein